MIYGIIPASIDAAHNSVIRCNMLKAFAVCRTHWPSKLQICLKKELVLIYALLQITFQFLLVLLPLLRIIWL